MDFCNDNISIEDALEEFDTCHIESCNLAINEICKKSKSLGCLASHLDASDEHNFSTSFNSDRDYESRPSLLSSPLLDNPGFSTFTFSDDKKEFNNSFTSVPNTIHIFDEYSNPTSSASSHTKHCNVPKLYDISTSGKPVCNFSRRRYSFPGMKIMDKPLVKKVKKIPTPFKSNYGVKLKDRDSNKANILSYAMINRLQNTGTD